MPLRCACPPSFRPLFAPFRPPRPLSAHPTPFRPPASLLASIKAFAPAALRNASSVPAPAKAAPAPPAPRGLLGDIASFDRTALKRAAKPASDSTLSPRALRQRSANAAAAPDAVVSPAGKTLLSPGGKAFNPADALRVGLRRTGVRRD